MTNPFTFDELRNILPHRVGQLPDPRKGQNTQYSIKDAPVGAFVTFYTQSSYPVMISTATSPFVRWSCPTVFLSLTVADTQRVKRGAPKINEDRGNILDAD